MQKYVVEAIGTFFLVLVIGLTVIAPGAGMMAPLAIGGTLMIMVYAGGYISGGHYNPAVTLAVTLRGKCDIKDASIYMLVQSIAAVLAAILTGYLKNGCMVMEGSPDVVQALIVEFLFTFALAYVVLQTATSRKTAGNSYYGLAIGFTVVAAAYAAGGISGGAFNPAVAIGITVMGLSKAVNIWYFLIGNFAGGALAAVVFKFLNPDDL